YGRLARSVIFGNSALRSDAATIIKNRRGQSGLWGYSVSGDLPIVLLQIDDQANIELVRQLVQAHAYWRLKGLAVDLVIWNEDRAGYRQLLQDQIMALIAAGFEANVIDRPGGIFVRPAEQISSEDRILFQSVARAIITDRRGTLAEQLGRHVREIPVPRLMPSKTARSIPVAECPWRELILFNGLGGFTPDGREYVITTAAGQATPAPWANVIANPYFGTIISENGLSYTWYENAHEYRLTPWYNDPVCDATGEVFYLRDEESGRFWSPAPLPIRGEDSYYISRHGFGYSVFEHTEDGIVSELSVFVAKDAPVKFSVLKVRNGSGRPRRLSATGYVEWVLGDLRSKSAMHVVTEIDPKTGALFARNCYNSEFANLVAFLDVDDSSRTLSGDRTEFLGRNGTLSNPAAMRKTRLSGKVGPALDPCGAIQISFDLANGQEREIIFRMGIGRDAHDASLLVERYRGSGVKRETFEVLCEYWKHTLGTVNVDTPDPSVNMLVNGWLLYQTIACRLWARSGYYQSGGAFGFRDQLQDVMALLHAAPQLMREQLLRSASRQFQEGDVQHWWHPPLGRGVRTHCSDDYLWLPLAVCRYVLGTGDTGVLDESVNFLHGRSLNPEDESYYDLPTRAEESASLYDHCVRAIKRGLNFGSHGLPLIGSCDWNDGMNLVGKEGKGESVWLAFFLYAVLSRFIGIARVRGDETFVQRCLEEMARLKENIESNAWDGHWYRRAYFDSGQPLGSASNDECQIDSISQSWSILSGAGDPERSREAMEEVDKRLVRREQRLIQLLDPPFDKSEMNPGYIKGYVPGVRENGGQYTHGAIWTTMAFAALGDSERAWELFGLINPINHANSPERVETYKVEPYVVAADVYAVAPHTGRGGWSWYTGSSGWMYRLIVESLLGLKLEVDKLSFEPCLPQNWQSYKIHYRFRETVFHITLTQRFVGRETVLPVVAQVSGPHPGATEAQTQPPSRKRPTRAEPKVNLGIKEEPVPRVHTIITVDGQLQKDSYIKLVDDRQEHLAEVIFENFAAGGENE
ncbi:MAG: cyclic beta 1-2 glucan synthetase, partial [Cyanobacteria bacterium]|nr:cyclic beta 1-2 glucan synthetase [Cyanobacteriota bacterium]